jgi:hypothetical protein
MALSKITNASVADTAVHGRRNLIINGAMQVAQRGTSGSVTTSLTYPSVDRFKTSFHGADQYAGTLSQDSEAPVGFSNSLKVTTTTAETAIANTEFFSIRHIVEAQNLQHLEYGTSDAKTMTLSFWVRSSVTGTYGISLYTQDNTRQRNTTYTINSADTWEYKTFTFEGDTTGGIDDNNGIGLEINFILAAGGNYTGTNATAWAAYANTGYGGGHTANGIATTANATWYITGVQLEVGDKSTPFEHRSFQDELLACMRYYEKSYDYADAPANTSGRSRYGFYPYGFNSNARFPIARYSVEKRAAPTMTAYSQLNGTSGKMNDGSGNDYSVSWTGIGTRGAEMVGSQTEDGFFGHWTADAEL